MWRLLFYRSQHSPGAKTISIQHFPNNARFVEPTLSQQFTDDLKDKFVSQTDLTLVNNNGDLQLDGEITGYTVNPVAITGDQTAALNRLEITVRVRYTNTLEESKDFDQKFSRYEDFPSTENQSSVQQGLIEQINKMLVEDIFNKAVVNW
ncbi:MAG: LptE family protein [Bacteroidota bacterium]|nr:LptE family protein [Bacteroidota bacterium]